jgi:phosphoribosylglycinamide formyltransferase-1
MRKLRLVVLISGKGSNLIAIADAIAAGRCEAVIELVVSDRASAGGLDFARSRNIASAVLGLRQYPDRAAWDAALVEVVARSEPDLVVSAGFMRVLGAAFLARFSRRTINLHPALLPLFPGTQGPADALAAGVRVSGCSVHVVDAGVDTGPIIAQAAVPVLPNDDVASLHERIQRAERVLLPRVIAAIARGEITLEPTLALRPSAADAEQTLFSLAPVHADGDGA